MPAYNNNFEGFKHPASLNRKEAEILLKSTFKIDHFYDNQWETIERILKGERVLLIEKTGFGKSLCFQFPALLFKGTTVIFSPLIALMRDQVAKLISLVRLLPAGQLLRKLADI